MRNWILPTLYASFALLSIITLSSVAPSLAGKQLISFCIGGVVYAAASYLPWNTYLSTRWYQYWGVVLLLILPLVAFDATRNTHRWIELGGGQTFQPSQLAVPFTILSLSMILIKAREYTWRTVGIFLATLAVPAALIFIEPDLGSTIVYVAATAVLLLLVPVPWQKICTLLGILLLAVVVGWFFIFHPYQKARITAFLNPDSPDNYNAHQALIAVGSGTGIGRGIGQGVQSHLRFLPERHTDFIFASFAEEYGFIGSSVLIGLYICLTGYILWQSHSSTEVSAQLFLITTAILFILQAAVNILMNMGLLPITGITLPFFSFGGSSILCMALLLGMVHSATAEHKPKATLHIS